MKISLLLLVILLAGCEDSYRLADNQVLCNKQHQAFYIKPNVGATSFVMRNPSLDEVCK
jgi:hypothetical protein